MPYSVQSFDPSVFDLSSPGMFWREEPDATLRTSLQEHKQLEPVIADFAGPAHRERPLLLAGYKRVRVLASLGRPVLTRQVPEYAASDKAGAGLVYLASNAGHSLDERLRFLALRYFQPLMAQDRLFDEIFPLLGLNMRSGSWRLHKAWLNAPDSLIDALEGGRVPFAMADAFDLFRWEGLECLSMFFTKLKWSRGAAVNFAVWLGEAAAREDVSPSELIERARLDSILSLGLSPKDTIEQLVGTVRGVRYPHLNRLEKRAADLCQGLVTGTPWRAAHNRNFEDGSVNLSVSVKNRRQLDEAVESLRVMGDSSLWQRLWHMGEDVNE